MAREVNKLNAKTVSAITKPGRHSDGGGLYLQVSGSGGKSWLYLFRDRHTGKLREKGLGSASVVGLAQARELAAAARKLVAEGTDPIAAAKAEPVATPRTPTFGEIADAFVASMASGFRNPKHLDQWKMTLDTYCKAIRSKPVDQIDTADVLEVLTPIWRKIPETASRLRGRIERVLAAAKAKGYRSGENPAQWKNHLDALLPKAKKLQRGHHPAMPYESLPAFIGSLRTREGVAARAVEFLVLTAARSGEVRMADWSEIDMKRSLWIIPGARMKAGKEHCVPLTPRALEIVSAMAPDPKQRVGLVFPSKARRGRPLSDMTLTAVLKRMKLGHLTCHGFRSSFRDWAGDRTHFPRELAEAALAHITGDQTERAYRRSDALERRRELMDAWAAFIEPGVFA